MSHLQIESTSHAINGLGENAVLGKPHADNFARFVKGRKTVGAYVRHDLDNVRHGFFLEIETYI